MSTGARTCVHTLLDWLRGHVAANAHLHLDSRSVQDGDVFFACAGGKTDGRQHIAEAVKNGAAAVVVQANEGRVLPDVSVPLLRVENLRDCLGELAHQWYGRATDNMTTIAVTGTNGKTTTTQWLAAALNAQGMPCGVIGTLGTTFPDGARQTGQLTTPDVLSLHRQLAALRDAGVQAVALEASSIGIEQERLAGVRIHVAAFTNLTHDHLDYHQTMQAYQAAKFRLFERPQIHHAVINVDDAAGRELAGLLAADTVCSYALNDTRADFHASQIQTGAAGLDFTLTTPESTLPICSRIIGRHNVANLLLVAAVLSCLKKQDRLAALLNTLQPVDGRMQIVPSPNADAMPLVVVDYAHTPDALARALQALRETVNTRGGKLWCVFGCGGDRDRRKRPVMGKLAQQHADAVVLTSDNPRSENPQVILDDIQSGLNPPSQTVQIDRALAILYTLWQAQPQDVVLIAGKGHETYQEIKGQRQPFDDRDWAWLALALRSGATLQTDSRTLRPDQLFLALPGENFDGHDYLHAAERKGASAALVNTHHARSTLRQIVVGDTRVALGKLGQAWRAQFGVDVTRPLIAVTGSNGKTTVKEMIADILRAWLGASTVLATAGNENNDLGVPLTLLNLRPAHRAAVVELGMNHPGEIAPLAVMAQPTIALVNNAQREHQEFLGSVDAVAQENASVFAALPANCVAVFPKEDAYAPLWESLTTHCRRMRFGWQAAEGVEVYASNHHAGQDSQTFTLHVPDDVPGERPQHAEIVLHVPGRHNVHNALAAAACAHAAGAPVQAIADGLASFRAVAGRMQRHDWLDGCVLIDDTYNANPESVLAAIDVLAALPGRKQLVLGDMAEVGEQGAAMHAEVGAAARQKGVDNLLTLGSQSRLAAQAFGEGALAFDDFDALIAYLLNTPAQFDNPANILVKGSRFMRMERVVLMLRTAASKKHREHARHAA